MPSSPSGTWGEVETVSAPQGAPLLVVLQHLRCGTCLRQADPQPHTRGMARVTGRYCRLPLASPRGVGRHLHHKALRFLWCYSTSGAALASGKLILNHIPKVWHAPQGAITPHQATGRHVVIHDIPPPYHTGGMTQGATVACLRQAREGWVGICTTRRYASCGVTAPPVRDVPPALISGLTSDTLSSYYSELVHSIALSVRVLRYFLADTLLDPC